MRTLAAAVALLTLGFAGQALAAPVAVRPVALEAKLEDKFKTDYGVREVPVIQRMVEEAVSEELARVGGAVAGDAAVRIEITLVDVKPSRPTFQQAVNKPGLDIARSVSNGGAELKARIVGADGAVLDEFTYRWYESDLTFADGNSTWSDARRAVNRFARRVAESYRAKAGA